MKKFFFLLLKSIFVFGYLMSQGIANTVSPLVSVGWVVQNLHQDDVVFLDIRNRLGHGSAESYRRSHIPGAIYSNYLTDRWRVTREGIRGQMPPVADLERLVGGLGIESHTHVIIVAGGYSALDMGGATRVYFTFKVLGHSKVSILDGGYKAYRADPSNPTEQGWNTPQPKAYVAQLQQDLIADRTQVVTALQNKIPLLDIRPPSQYAHQTIPSARSLPEDQLIVAGGYFITPERAQRLLHDLNLLPTDPAIMFCNTGHWASLGWFVGHEILGNQNIKLYDGSMIDWTSHPSLPVTRGTQ